MRAEEIARRRLRNSGLVRSSFTSAVDVVRWHVAVQAQDWGPTKWSIGERASGVTDADVDAALARGSIVRTHLLRPTWHVVAREDVRWLLALTGPIVQRGNARRLRELNLDATQLARSQRVISRALEGGERLTRVELGKRLAGARVDPGGQRLPYILMHCELEALIGSAGLSGKQHTYGLLDERVPGDRRRFDRDEAVVELTRRYLAGHGPASPQDLGWWSSLSIGDVRKALEALGEDVRSETVDGVELWMSAEEPAGAAAVRGVHLLPPYDEVIVGYRQSRYLGDPRAPEAMAAWKDRTLPNGVILVRGRVAGLWRRATDPGQVRVDAHLFGGLEATARGGLESAVRRLGRFLGHPATLAVAPLGRAR